MRYSFVVRGRFGLSVLDRNEESEAEVGGVAEGDRAGNGFGEGDAETKAALVAIAGAVGAFFRFVNFDPFALLKSILRYRTIISGQGSNRHRL